MERTIGLDTNVLARYFVSPKPTDAAECRQSALAIALIDSGQPLAVCKTVLLELEWVLRGYYGYPAKAIRAAFDYLLSQPHINIEDRPQVENALRNSAAGLDFADALHHASYATCARVASFDDRGFARRSDKLKLQPPVKVPLARKAAAKK